MFPGTTATYFYLSHLNKMKIIKNKAGWKMNSFVLNRHRDVALQGKPKHVFPEFQGIDS